MKNSEAVLVVIFWNYATFYRMCDSTHVKQNLISCKRNCIDALPYEFRRNVLGTSQTWVET